MIGHRALVLATALGLCPWLVDDTAAQRSGSSARTVHPGIAGQMPRSIAPDLICTIQASKLEDLSWPIWNGGQITIAPGDPEKKIWLAVKVENKGVTEAKDVQVSFVNTRKNLESGAVISSGYSYFQLNIASGSPHMTPSKEVGVSPITNTVHATATVDVGDQVTEANEQNNECTIDFKVVVEGVHIREPNLNPIPIPALPPVQRPSRP